MKQYTGTKTVKAVPMTYGEAHERGLIRENAYVEEYNDNKGYHVIYPDGYESWSPAEVFEDAYKLSETPLDRLNIEIADLKQKADKLGAFIFNKNGGKCRPSGLSFEQILPMLREGFSIRRAGWNGKGLMVFKQVPAHITSEIIPKMQSLPDEAKRLVLASGDHIDYVAQCLIFNPTSGEANSWVPSISDVFATDWELVM